MTRPPFATLKLSLLLVLAAAMLASGGTFWSWSKVQQATAARQQQHSLLDSARQKLDRSHQQQRLIESHLGAYQALVARGFVGPEARLAWVEAAQLANQSSGLYGLDYRLTPRTSASPTLAPDLPLGQTAMTLTLPLLVETDLARFLVALKARAPGLHRVQGCRMSRLGDAAFEAVNLPRLQAECELLWFTVAMETGNAS